MSQIVDGRHQLAAEREALQSQPHHVLASDLAVGPKRVAVPGRAPVKAAAAAAFAFRVGDARIDEPIPPEVAKVILDDTCSGH